MLKIGEFSKLSRVSVRMLRHYDEIGLLKPAEIDRFTDYRYYREDQLPMAGRIAALKDMGFSLADIVRILEVYDDREKMEQFFSARQEELEALSKDTAYKLTLLDAARKRLRKEEDMSYNVTLKTIPERYAATIRMTIPRYEDEGMIWGKLAEETCRMNLVEDDPCLCAVTYLDGEYKEENVEMMAWKTVRGSYPDTEHVKFRTLPEVTEDRQGKLSGYRACEVPHAAGGYGRKLHLPGQLYSDHGCLHCGDRMDGSKRLRAC